MSPYHYKLGFDPRQAVQDALAHGLISRPVIVPRPAPIKPGRKNHTRPELEQFRDNPALYHLNYTRLKRGLPIKGV
jgi:hypothetical protein